MIRAGIVGATGYTGAELVRILSGHPEVELAVITSTQYAGKEIANIYPALTGRVRQRLETFDPDTVADRTDVVFTALPHKLPMEIVPGLLERGVKVIDLSADFRFEDPALYARHYQPHSAPGLLESAVYGLTEVFAAPVAAARLVGNPGCYPTCTLLPLIPLLQDGLIEPQGIVIDAKSGISGAGRAPSLKTHFCEVTESFKPYNVGRHRHAPEMEAILAAWSERRCR
jgi:N-acetyl-gamma-glutamyl-phosphate reductase